MATNDVNVTATQAPLRVLIVEDSPEDFDLCVRTLEKAKLNISAAQVASRESFHDLVATNTYEDRKSTRLNSSHVRISYAVFCLKKKKKSTTYRLHNMAKLTTRVSNV